jgi:hypothetical protein
MKLISPELMYKIKQVSAELEHSKKYVERTGFNSPEFVQASRDMVNVTSWVQQMCADS